MPSKRKKHKLNPTKTKKHAATERSHSRARATNASRRKTAKKGSSKKALTSKRSSPRKKRPAVSEIEQATRDRKLMSGEAQSDYQGISRAEEADSESVEELVEEGNIAESGAVAGVEQADNEDEREVHTRQLPEDDVPDEYLEKE